jgi:glycosyltransferase involved in cell wall biosynthesis
MKFSVLLSVYYKESPSNLKKALCSIIDQTITPNEVILVEDGKLNQKLYDVIDYFIDKYPKIIKVIKLEKNQGLGKALSIGLKKCKYDLIARMDSDDISKNNRFEKQLKVFKKNPDIDIVGSWVKEFENNIDNIISKRKVPETNEKILKFAKQRNPFNHPTVMYRKKSVLDAGNYIDFYLNEDYYLWLRMLNMGFQGYNIQESLLYFRVSKDTFKRRGGVKYAVQDIKLQNKMLKMEFINNYEYIINILTKPATRILPNFLREYIYKSLLR